MKGPQILLILCIILFPSYLAAISVVTHMSNENKLGSIEYVISNMKYNQESCGGVLTSGKFVALNNHTRYVKIPNRDPLNSYCFQFIYRNDNQESNWTQQLVVPDYEVSSCEVHVYIYNVHLSNPSVKPILKISDANSCEFEDD